MNVKFSSAINEDATNESIIEVRHPGKAEDMVIVKHHELKAWHHGLQVLQTVRVPPTIS